MRVLKFCDSHWSYSPTDVEPTQLSAYEALALISLVRCGGWIDSCCIGPLQSSSIKLTPLEPQFKYGQFGRLISAGLASPNSSSPEDAFYEQHGQIIGWEPEMVCWSLRVPDPVKFVRTLENIIDSNAWPEPWQGECSGIWQELAVAECWEFCEYSLAQRNLPVPGTTAALSLFNNLLRDFSVSQCYQLIWASASDATDYRARKGVSPQHAANYLVGACQRRADRYRAEGWAIKGFQRNFSLGRSQVSHVLHDVFLQHGEAGFFSCPSAPFAGTSSKHPLSK